MSTHRELTAAGITTRHAALLTGIARATADRATARARRTLPAAPAEPPLASVDAVPAVRRIPANQLSETERAAVLSVLHSDEFIDATPLQIYATLLEREQYLCSPSTMYRILRANAQVKDRRNQARHPARARPELIATGPGQVFTWDITKLKGPTKGSYFDAYVMIDIYSRFIVGARVHPAESAVLAEQMMRHIFALHGAPQVLHADRGTSMTSKSVAALLEDLGITRSHSRPRVSNDNPFSEAWFKTLKYSPVFPDRFGSVQHARTFLDEFVEHYNHQHHHTGIGLHTPADVHYGHTGATTKRRNVALTAARQATPERFGPTPSTPKMLELPAAAWINPPPQPEVTTQVQIPTAA